MHHANSLYPWCALMDTHAYRLMDTLTIKISLNKFYNCEKALLLVTNIKYHVLHLSQIRPILLMAFIYKATIHTPSAF